jgi:hypothetical protein
VSSRSRTRDEGISIALAMPLHQYVKYTEHKPN